MCNSASEKQVWIHRLVKLSLKKRIGIYLNSKLNRTFCTNPRTNCLAVCIKLRTIKLRCVKSCTQFRAALRRLRVNVRLALHVRFDLSRTCAWNRYTPEKVASTPRELTLSNLIEITPGNRQRHSRSGVIQPRAATQRGRARAHLYFTRLQDTRQIISIAPFIF